MYGDLDYLDLDVIVLVVVRLGQHQLQGDEAGHMVAEGEQGAETTRRPRPKHGLRSSAT